MGLPSLVEPSTSSIMLEDQEKGATCMCVKELLWIYALENPLNMDPTHTVASKQAEGTTTASLQIRWNPGYIPNKCRYD